MRLQGLTALKPDQAFSGAVPISSALCWLKAFMDSLKELESLHQNETMSII
jgi:hypothetical protein